jgi:crotonobetainyl-CoA:carnitine CoA-transferase CaiB-like acyl-CoA transferase
MVGADIMDALFGLPLRRVDPRKSDNPFYDVYKTKDGRWLQLTAGDRYAAASDPEGRTFWHAFCRALDRADLAEDPRFATTALRQEHKQELAPLLNAQFETRTYADWEPRLRAEKLMYAPILSPEQVIVDPQAEANNFWAEVDQPDVGHIKLINSPTHFYEDPAQIKGPAPQLAEHTDEVLGALGYKTQDISRLRDDKVIL